MDMIVLCPCGHPTPLHDARRCHAGRYQPCRCRLDSEAALETAIVQAAWRDEGVLKKDRDDDALRVNRPR
jgi:hypothetical protein